MICGQSLQALAFLLAKASQAGSVDVGAASGVENLLVTSFTSGAAGVESEISTGLHLEGKGERCESEPGFDLSYSETRASSVRKIREASWVIITFYTPHYSGHRAVSSNFRAFLEAHFFSVYRNYACRIIKNKR